jgi:iron complex outermembrane receptor protein
MLSMHHRKHMKYARVTHLPPPQALKNWRCQLMRALVCLGASTAALPSWAEDLLKIEISSASRKVQQVQDVAAAVFVISRDDILRSGARTLPEALRMAPGVEVARIANNRWAVSIRGFNGRFANKLLVLKDGRSVYSPLFSGVLWEAEDTTLRDIERIEVVRGPGAAMWGANAVNGVINIISRSAGETLGTALMASTGTDERGAVALSHGLAVGDGQVRLSFKGFEREPSRATSGEKGNDGWTAARLGLRGDWPAQGGGQWSLVSEAYQSRADERRDLSRFSSAPPTFDARQANSGGHVSLHREQRQTISGDYQRRLPLGRHELTLGASYRYSQDNIDVNNRYASQPEQRQRAWRIASVYAHDDYELMPQQLRLSGGVRMDHDNWSGTQVQANVRLAWTPDTKMQQEHARAVSAIDALQVAHA